MLSTLGHSSLHSIQLQLSLHVTLSVENHGVDWLATISASAVLPGHILCREPGTTLICNHSGFSCPARAPSAQSSPGPPTLYPSFSPVTPSGHPLYRESWSTQVYIHFSFSYLAKVPAVSRVQVPLASTHFSFSYFARARSVYSSGT